MSEVILREGLWSATEILEREGIMSLVIECEDGKWTAGAVLADGRLHEASGHGLRDALIRLSLSVSN